MIKLQVMQCDLTCTLLPIQDSCQAAAIQHCTERDNEGNIANSLKSVTCVDSHARTPLIYKFTHIWCISEHVGIPDTSGLYSYCTL